MNLKSTRKDRPFDLNTIQILSNPSIQKFPIQVLVRGKLIGGKRFKREWIWLSNDEYRDIKLRELFVQ